MDFLPEDLLKLLLAIVIGGLLGAEREVHRKAAGFRTITLITVGATLFTIFSMKLGATSNPTRIAANIVSGVGFLGAGVILRESGRIVGLTTASTIWLAAALGMGIGGGNYLFTGVVTIAVLIVLRGFARLEQWIEEARHSRSYEIVCPFKLEKLGQFEAMFRRCGLRLKGQKHLKRDNELVCSWDADGTRENHDRLTEKLLADPEVKTFTF